MPASRSKRKDEKYEYAPSIAHEKQNRDTYDKFSQFIK